MKNAVSFKYEMLISTIKKQSTGFKTRLWPRLQPLVSREPKAGSGLKPALPQSPNHLTTGLERAVALKIPSPTRRFFLKSLTWHLHEDARYGQKTWDRGPGDPGSNLSATANVPSVPGLG